MSGVDKQTMDKAAELFGWAYGLGGFDVAVLEFVTFVRAQVLQQLAPELERYDIQGGDGNGVYPDKDKDGEWCKAEDALSVIGSLREAFNIKCRVDAEEQAESVKLQNVLFANYRDCRPADAGLFGWAAAALIAKAQGVVMPEHETSTPSSKWSSAGEPDPHGKAYDCERAELSMGEYTDDELANAVFMHDHRSFDIVATMRGEPGSIVLLTAAKDRIRWLSRSLDKALARLSAAPVQQVSVPDEMRSLAQRLREYNQNPHHINPMSEAFHILVADAASALSTACVPKEIAAAITWSEHLLFECGALTSTRAPSVHVYNKTFAAVNEARAMLAAAPAAPAADAWIAVSERLPESERTVLAFYNNSHGKSRRVRAEYIAHMSKGADDGWDGDADAYYDEATDESYWPAGWYEVIDNWDDLTHMVIHEGEVSHWMPLPAAPIKIEANRHDQ